MTAKRPEPRRDVGDGPPGHPAPSTFPWWADAWLAGSILLAIRNVRNLLDLRRRRRAWSEASGPVLALFERCRRESGVAPSVRLLVAPDDFGPATLGAFRPCVVVPGPLLARLSSDELRHVLLHELAHVRRRDVLTDRLAATSAALHWFNLFAWLALAKLRQEREPACDEWVLRLLGSRAAGSYGHTLLTVAGHLTGRATSASVVGIFGNIGAIDRRIMMITGYKTPSLVRRLFGPALLLAVAVAGLTDAAPAPSGVRNREGKPITIAGVCRDKDGKPVAGVTLALYREHYWNAKAERVQLQTSDEKGGFAFRDVPPPPDDQGGTGWRYTVVVSKAGHAATMQGLFGRFLTEPLEFQIRPAATLQGQVTDPSGKPVAGARVWTLGLAGLPVDGIGSARTDVNGHYEIRDMAAWDPEATKPQPIGKGLFSQVIECYFDVLHPDFAHERPAYRGMPATVNVALRPAGVLEGKVIDHTTAKPAAGVRVFMQGTGNNRFGGSAPAITDAEGRYRIRSLVAGTYNVLVDAPDRVCAALDSIAIEPGKTRRAPELVLEEGGWIEGRLLDTSNGKPLSGKIAVGRLSIGLYGPARPKSGGACQMCSVDDQGRFRIRATPGVNYPYIMRSDYWNRTEGKADFEKGVEVKSGASVRLEFKVLPPVTSP